LAPSSAASESAHLIWMAEPDGRVTYLNRSAQHFFQVEDGKDPDEAWLARVHPEDRVAVMNAWQRSLKTGSRYRYEFRFLDVDSQSRRCLAQALPMRNAEGEILRWLGSTIDVESYYERASAPGVLDFCYQLLTHETSFSRFGSDRDSASAPSLDYRQIMEFLPMKAWSATPDGEVDFVNLQWREYTDITNHESLGQGWINAVHAEDQEPIKAAWRQIMDAGIPGSVDYRLRHHDGSYRRCNSRAEPLFDETGQVQRWIGTVVDLENRYSLQSSLGESEARHQQLLEHLPKQAMVSTIINLTQVKLIL
jgi:PAS domain S-box-containing protein